MTACALERIGADNVITGELTAAEATDLEQHLSSDCDVCERVMQSAGLDEQTLLMLVSAAGQQQLAGDHAGRIDAIWQKVAAQLPVSNVVPLRPVRSLAGPRRLWSRPQFWAAAPVFAAAAILLLVVLPKGIDPGGDGHDGMGLKGDAALPEIALFVRGVNLAAAPNDSVAGLHYDLERDGWLTLYHWRPDAAPIELFAGNSVAATGGAGRFPVGNGYLAYRFDDEPGRHLFVLCVTDGPINTATQPALFDALFDTAWFDAPQHETHIDGEVAGRAVAVHAVLVNVEGTQRTP